MTGREIKEAATPSPEQARMLRRLTEISGDCRKNRATASER